MDTWARLKLYSYLHRLREQVLYYDTDSVIYTWKEGQPKIEIGQAEAFFREKNWKRCFWNSNEINKALEKDYELLEVHEVWHFEESASGLFAEYVNAWLKIKTETALQTTVEGKGRHHLTERGKESWPKASGQVNVELFLGQVWQTHQ